jgi:dTDP-4-dehydrorhamnose 3,5-epimerase
MEFADTAIPGVVIVDLKRLEDERGFFARSFCTDEFAAHGLDTRVVQCNVSYNERAGTIRGMHYQGPPSPEAKLVRCTSGAVHDVVIDMRPESPTYLQHVAVELSSQNRRALYVPELVAHGFQTLVDDTEVFYQMNVAFDPGGARGFRYDDPAFGIQWPLAVTSISEKDASIPLLSL